MSIFFLEHFVVFIICYLCPIIKYLWRYGEFTNSLREHFRKSHPIHTITIKFGPYYPYQGWIMIVYQTIFWKELLSKLINNEIHFIFMSKTKRFRSSWRLSSVFSRPGNYHKWEYRHYNNKQEHPGKFDVQTTKSSIFFFNKMSIRRQLKVVITVIAFIRFFNYTYVYFTMTFRINIGTNTYGTILVDSQKKLHTYIIIQNFT